MGAHLRCTDRGGLQQPAWPARGLMSLEVSESRLDDAKFRIQLAVLAVLQFMAVGLDAWLSAGGVQAWLLHSLFWPFASTAIVFVGCAIFLKWKPGIYLFIFSSSILLILSAGTFFNIVLYDEAFGKRARLWKEVLMDALQMLMSLVCLGYGIWALIPVKDSGIVS